MLCLPSDCLICLLPVACWSFWLARVVMWLPKVGVHPLC